jgi:carbonic anhydrase
MLLMILTLLLIVAFCISGTKDWHGSCSHGRQQSPIDLTNNKATKVYDIKPFHFEHYRDLPTVERITNNGHSVTFTLEEPEDELYPKVLFLLKYKHYKSINFFQGG